MIEGIGGAGDVKPSEGVSPDSSGKGPVGDLSGAPVIHTLDDLRNWLIAQFGPDAGNEIYNEYILKPMCISVMTQVKAASDRAARAAAEMRSQGG